MRNTQQKVKSRKKYKKVYKQKKFPASLSSSYHQSSFYTFSDTFFCFLYITSKKYTIDLIAYIEKNRIFFLIQNVKRESIACVVSNISIFRQIFCSSNPLPFVVIFFVILLGLPG